MHSSSKTANFFKLEEYLCTKYRTLAKRNGNNYVNGKNDLNFKVKYKNVSWSLGTFQRSFFKCGRLGKVLIKEEV